MSQFLHICESHLGPYELQYPFLIPTDIDEQLLLSNLPSKADKNFPRGLGMVKKIKPKEQPKKSTQNLTYLAGFFLLLLENVAII